MAKKGWDVRTNLNDSPDSQGTLFSGGSDQMSDARYARGYSPERRDAVADAIVKPQVSWDWQGNRLESRGVNSSNARDTADVSRKPVRDMVDNVARSTVPIEHLQGLQFRSYPGRYIPTGAAGVFTKPSTAYHPADSPHNPAVQIAPKYADTPTTIHEIGHAVSHTNFTPHSQYRTAEDQGTEEAYADNYAETHYRNRQGKQEDKGTYGGGPYALSRPEEFWGGYRNTRSYNVHSAEIASQDAEYFKQYPEDKVHADGSSDEPLIYKEFVPSDAIKKGRKPQLEGINPEALP